MRSDEFELVILKKEMVFERGRRTVLYAEWRENGERERETDCDETVELKRQTVKWIFQDNKMETHIFQT